jgi:holo-[acyl-carrier protein] synthase
MILGVGLDLVPISRMATLLARHGTRAERRLFSERERADCADRGLPAQHYAARFAAKEAAAKALGVPAGLRWLDIEVHSLPGGAPVLVFSGVAHAAAARRSVTAQHVSLTHAGDMAAAVVVLEGLPA